MNPPPAAPRSPQRPARHAPFSVPVSSGVPQGGRQPPWVGGARGADSPPPARRRRPGHPGRADRADRGLTLLELVAATAIFALVAVMATQALTGGLIQRRALGTAADQAEALARTLTLMRQDLAAAVPLPHLPAAGPGGPALEPLPTGGFALSRAAPDGGLARVVWRVDPGRSALIRASAPLTGAGSPEGGEALLRGVTAIRLIARGVAPEGGLPPGLEAVIETRDRGTLRVVVAR